MSKNTVINNLKYYNNLPCEIIRKISDDFYEIKIYPKFNDDVNSANWCTACILGSMDGANPSHTCEEYEDVISSLESIDNAICIIAENRLIADEPFEFKPIKSLVRKINEKKEYLEKLNNKIINITSTIEKYSEIKYQDEKHIEILENKIKNKIDELKEYLEKIKKVKSEYELNVPNDIKLTKIEYENLIQRDRILEKLERGGVRNWEWYYESLKEEQENRWIKK